MVRGAACDPLTHGVESPKRPCCFGVGRLWRAGCSACSVCRGHVTRSSAEATELVIVSSLRSSDVRSCGRAVPRRAGIVPRVRARARRRVGRAIDDESGDLEDLTLTADGRLRLLLRGEKVLLCGGAIALDVRYHREESGGDRVRGTERSGGSVVGGRGHAVTMRRPAYRALTERGGCRYRRHCAGRASRRTRSS